MPFALVAISRCCSATIAPMRGELTGIVLPIIRDLETAPLYPLEMAEERTARCEDREKPESLRDVELTDLVP